MAETLHRVELTDSFLECLEAIEAFLIEADAGAAFDDLLDQLRSTVIPNLARFPRIGRRYLDQPPQSAESLSLLAAMPTGLSMPSASICTATTSCSTPWRMTWRRSIC